MGSTSSNTRSVTNLCEISALRELHIFIHTPSLDITQVLKYKLTEDIVIYHRDVYLLDNV